MVKFKTFLNDLNILYFDELAAEKFARTKARLKIEGNLIEDMDLIKASIALANSCILVTNNVKHFKRIDGLKIENWSEE